MTFCASVVINESTIHLTFLTTIPAKASWSKIDSNYTMLAQSGWESLDIDLLIMKCKIKIFKNPLKNYF
jgi:hypothetical protein